MGGGQIENAERLTYPSGILISLMKTDYLFLTSSVFMNKLAILFHTERCFPMP